MADLAQESIWFNKAQCDDAERMYFEKLSGAKKRASSEEPAGDIDTVVEEKPAAVVKPIPSASKAKGQSVKAKKADTKKNSATNNEVAWPNKVECDEAEKRLQERLAQSEYRNSANAERSFIMLKPDAVQRGLVGAIIERFEERGFKLLAAKFMLADDQLLRTHYTDLANKGFFPELIRYMGSGPVVPMVWQGLDVVRQGRVMLGATNPKDSAPGTIRGDFCVDVGRNIIHGSDSVEAANREISLWFSPQEIASWRSVATEWVYEDEELEGDLTKVDGLVAQSGDIDMALASKLNDLVLENEQLKKVTSDLKGLILKLESRVAVLEGGAAPKSSAPAAPAAAEEDDDDVDLFGSDDEDEESKAEKERITAERLKAYAEKKSKKPAVIAKTSVLFDVKPWDDETDMDAMLKEVKSVEMDGLVWGAHKLIPVGYGINKLQVMCTVEDEKVSIEELSEKIEEFEDFVQSVDIAAMNKI